MRSHLSSILPRLIRAAMRSDCVYRVAAIGLNSRGIIIGISTNTHRLVNRGWHAEERLMHRSPKSLSSILILRVGATGNILPIDPCKHCAKLASKRGISIRRAIPS